MKWRIIAGLAVFAVAFGYVEAAVVAYLRSIYTPLRAQFYPGSGSELFPLLSVHQLTVLGPEHIARLRIELGRELATLLMLAGVAIAVARNIREWVACFILCFGIWDITFYCFLKLILNWPASLMTWDILFLLPVPWVGPVLAPVLVSLSMICAGLIVLRREHVGRPIVIGAARWFFILVGGAITFLAFIADFRNTSGGGAPNPFHWGIFLIGEAVALAAFLSALLGSCFHSKILSSR